MNEREAQEQLMVQLAPELSCLGFSRAEEWNFVRFAGGGIMHRLSFDVSGREPGGFSFGCGVGIRFEEIERVIGRSDQGQYKATIGMPIHLLREDQRYDRWFFSTPGSLQRVVREVLSEVRRYALLFLERYSSLDALRAALESNPSNWFGLGPSGRIEVLAAILFVQDGAEFALSFLS